MLYPFSPKVGDKRQRTYHDTVAALAMAPIPNVFIFNVGPREWKGVGGGREWTIPACPKGARHSAAVKVPMIVLSERDLADGGNHCDTVVDAAMSGTRKVAGEDKQIMGVCDDIIGTNSTSPGLGIHSTSGKWQGVFATQNEEPTDEEIEEANSNLRAWSQEVYQIGADMVSKGETVNSIDRKQYNDAAQHLGLKLLWGNNDYTLVKCPECRSDIQEGAIFCKECRQDITPAAVETRRRKRDKEAAKLAKDDAEVA